MNAREVTMVTPPRAASHLLLAGKPFPAEALGVADHGIEPGVGDGLEQVRRLRQIRG